jgi:hypothetical protein
MDGTASEPSRPMAARVTSIRTSRSRMKIAPEARVSNFRWPYGCCRSAGRPAARIPTSATMLEVLSVSEWKPSETMLTVPVA